MTIRAGKVGSGHAKQHVDLFRKLQLRKVLLEKAGSHLHAGTSAAYLPFCGDGDLAIELGLPGRFAKVVGVDLDEARVARFTERLTYFGPLAARSGAGIVANADAWSAALDVSLGDRLVAYADFDAYVYPYDSFRAAWAEAPWAERVVVAFTDGTRQTVKRVGKFRTPDGADHDCSRLPLAVRRAFYNAWWSRYVEPWFRKAVAPAVVVATMRYMRQDMLYWGAVLDR